MEELLTRPILLMTLAMVLAIAIERLLEIIRSFRDFFEARTDSYQAKWYDRANKLRQHIEKRLDNAKGGSPGAFNTVLTIVARHLSVNPDDTHGPLAISVDKVRSASIRLRYKVLAVSLGIVFAYLFQIDLVELVRVSTMSVAEGAKLPEPNPGHLGIIITGVAMGFGSGPVHSLITSMEKARRLRKSGEQ